MAETGRLAAGWAWARDSRSASTRCRTPSPARSLVKVAIANVCGSDMHYWKGEQD